MKKFLHLFTNQREGINKIHFVLLFLFIASSMLGQSINTSKTVSSSSCGILDVQLGFTGVSPTKGPIEVVLVIDVSGSMGSSSGTPTSLSRAQTAAVAFVNKILDDPSTLNGLNPTGLNKVGLVSFSSNASLIRNLTTYNETGLNNGRTDLIVAINSLVANGNTNNQDGIVIADKELKLSSTGFNCNTTRSIVLLTDGVTNRTGPTDGSVSCNTVPTFPATTSCITAAIDAATNAKTTTPSDNPALTTTYNNQIYAIGLFGGISGNDENVARATLQNISSGTGSPYYFETQSSADLTTIYGQIANQLNYVAKDLVVTETIPSGYAISNVTVSSGSIAPVSPPTTGPAAITWTNNLLTTSPITLSYKLTPDGTKCGNQQVSTTGYKYVNSLCNPVTGQSVNTPDYFIQCKPIITGSPSVCTGNVGSVYSVPNTIGHTYSWSVVGGTITAGAGTNSITVTWGAAGTGKVDVTDTASGCSLIATQNVTINALPIVNAGSPFTKTCIANISGATIGETAVAGHTYSWTSVPSGFISSDANPLVNPSATTTYTVVKTNTASGCSASANVTVTVNNSAIAVNAGNGFTKTCIANTSGATIGETAVAGHSYSWTSVPSGFISSDANPLVNPSATTTYTVVKTNTASGCSASANVTVTVNNSAIAVNAGNGFTKTCIANTSGATIGETAVAGHSYSWTSVPSGFISSDANPLVNPSVTTTYTVVKTNTASGCSASANVTVTVNNSAITVNAGNGFTKTCIANTSGATIGETAAAGHTYSWTSSPSGFTSSDANPLVNPSVTTTYTVLKTNTASGCTATASVTVTVNNSAITVSAGNGFTKTCTANTSGATIGETAAAGHTYSWTSVPSGFTSSDANPLVNPSATTTYTVVKTNTSSGCTATASVTVTVNNSAITVNAGSPFTKTCTANISGATIGETTVAGHTYFWTSVPSGFTSSDANPLVNPSVTTTYTVVKTNIASGCSASANVTVTVNNSAITVNAGNGFTKTCTANTSGATIGETAVAGHSYSWTSVPSGFISSDANPLVNPSVTTTYTVLKTNTSSGCSASANVTVTVNNSAITVNAGSPFTKTCTANTSGATIGETAVVGHSYSWTSVPSGFISSDANPLVNPSVTTTYTVIKTNIASGCTATASVTVTVNNSAIAVNAGNGFTKTCTANTSGATIGETAVAGHSYSWTSVPSGFTSSDANPLVNPSVTTTYTVVKTNTASGCSASANVTVTVNNSAITVNAGNGFTKTCTANISGATIGETAVAGHTYSWTSSPSGFTSSDANPLVNPSVTTTYTVVKTNTASGCTATASVTVTVNNSAITVNAGSPFTKTCIANISGATIGETAVAGHTYSWTSSPSGFTSSDANPLVNPSVTTTYTVVKTNTSSGCSASANVTVTVNNSAIAVSAGSPFTKTCIANTSGATIGETAAAGHSYSWTSVPSGFISSDANPLVNPSVTTTYTVVKTNTASGCTATASVTVTVNNSAITVNAGSPFTKTCIANISGATIGETAVAGHTYSWTSSPSGFTSSDANPLVNPSVTTTYTVVKTNTASGCSASANVTVTVNNSAITVNAGSPFIKTCTSNISGATIGETAVAGHSYSWTSVPSGFISSDANPLVNPSVTTTYTVVKTNIASGCSASANVTVTVNTAVPLLIVSNPASVCSPLTVDITANNVQTTNNGTSTKYYTTLELANAGGTSDVNLPTAISISGVYYIRSEFENGCFIIKPVTVSISSCSIALVKEAVVQNTDNCTKVGNTISYTFTVTNPGTTPISNITINDPLFTLPNPVVSILFTSGDTNSNMSLDSNETWIYKATYIITQNNIDSGYITNQATVNGLVLGNNPVSDLSGTNPTNNNPTITRLCQKPAIAIVKTNDITTAENGCTTIKVGDKVTYTFTVSNSGNVSLHNVAVSDLHQGLSAIALQSGDTNTNTILDINEIWIYKADYIVTLADINTGSITNQASVNALAPDNSTVSDQSGSSSNTNEPDVIPICTNPSILITKDGTYVDSNQDGKTNIGDVVSYKFVITNTGNVTLTNVKVTDINAVVTGGSIATLAPGASDTTTFSASHTITQADINKGFVYNLALATAKDPKGNDVTDTSSDPTPCTTCPKDPECMDCTITELNQTPSILITKDGTYVDSNQDGKTNTGDVVSYKFVITNTGNVTLTNVKVTDINAVVTGGSILTLAPGVSDATTFTASHTITQADINKGLVYNLALATAKDPKGNDVTDTSSDPTPCTTCPKDPECVDCTITELNQTPSILITKDGTYVDSNQDGKTNIGDVVTYKFVITNTGNVTLTNVKVTDINAVVTGGSILTLAPGASDATTFTASHTITQADINKGLVYNLALATAKDPKGNDVTDTSSDPTPCTTCPKDPECMDCTITELNQTPSILITKDGTYVDSNQDGKTNIGDVVSYKFVITNTGNVTLTNVKVTDINAVVTGGSILTLAPGASDSTTFSASHAITQADINKGLVYNLALATAKDPKGNDVTDTSSDPTPCTTCPKDPECADCTITEIPQSPELTVDKTATVTSNGNATDVYSFVGDVINYTINVRNTGNVTIHNIVVKDPLTGLDTTNQPFTLAPDENRNFMQEYTITLNDLRVDNVTNIATATGLTPNNTPIEAEDTVIVEKATVLGCGTIVVHNAFTPNQDGINDNFVIDNITDTTCYPENSVEIYNRWGILVYETKGYDNMNNAFKGYSEGRVTVDKSAGLPTGTYFYILNYTAVGLQGEVIGRKQQGYLYLTR